MDGQVRDRGHTRVPEEWSIACALAASIAFIVWIVIQH
jgi:hypothetical protein